LAARSIGQTIVWASAAAWPAGDRARRRLDRNPDSDLSERGDDAGPQPTYVPTIPFEAPFDFKRFKRFTERVQPALRAIEN
jgi:hypothetical protein